VLREEGVAELCGGFGVRRALNSPNVTAPVNDSRDFDAILQRPKYYHVIADAEASTIRVAEIRPALTHIWMGGVQFTLVSNFRNPTPRGIRTVQDYVARDLDQIRFGLR